MCACELCIQYSLVVHKCDTISYTIMCVYIPYRVCFGPDAGTTERVGLIVSALPLLLWLQAELTHCLVHCHVVGQQVISNVEL